MQNSLIKKVVLIVFLAVLAACGESSNAGNDVSARPAGNTSSAAAEDLEKTLAAIEADAGIKLFKRSWTGDLDVMADERLIRVLTVYGLGRYYLEEGREKGLTYEWFKMFEDFVNQKLKTGDLKVHVVFIPVARDQLIPGLLNGRGDIAAAGLTITPERAEFVDFSASVYKDIAEILVTGPSAPAIGSVEDLAGREISVRASSSYRSSLDAMNQHFREKGLEEIRIGDVVEQLEDDDLLEMVNSGMLDWAVVDDYKAKAWAGVFDKLTLREDLVFRSGGEIGFAMRKGSPKLAGVLNEFIKTHKQGSLETNILINRYLRDFDWAANALAANDLQRFHHVVDIFSRYGQQYGVDYLMVAAQGYQESRLDQNKVSKSGAIGIMQLLPSTAADPNVGIPDITTIEPNIHAGVKYLNFIRNRYYPELEADKFNQTLFALAAYNAGPAKVAKLREMAEEQGYNPNIWFDNVEVIASKVIGAETVQYVANILKYYVAYSLTVQRRLEREQVRKDAGIQ